MTDTETLAPRPPISTGLSPAAYLERYEQDRLGFLLWAAERYGPVAGLTEDTVLVNDPAAVHEVLRRTNTDFLVTRTIRRDEVSGERGDPATDAWMRGRRATQKAMSPEALSTHRQWLAQETERLVAAWAKRGTVTDPVGELERLTARSFARFSFGTRDFGAAPRHTGELLEAITPLIASPFQFPEPIRRLLPRYRRSVRAQADLEREVRRILALPGEGGLVDTLAASGLGTEGIVQMMIANGLASYRVPAAALAWALVALARHPGVADECAESGPADPAGTTPPILHWTLAESLRLWPPNWLILRSARGEQVCAGWRIPAGAAVVISPYVMHRTAPDFPDPLAFSPHRWSTLQPAHGAYLPYGIGSRWCVGKALADVELTTLLTGLAGRLRFTVEAMDARPQVRTTLLPAGLTLGVRPR